MKKGKKNCFYNSSGEKTEGGYDYDSIVKIGNCYQTKKDGKYGVLNEQGEEVFSPVYNNISDFGVFGGSFSVYAIRDYFSDVQNSIIKTGELERVDLSDMNAAALHGAITSVFGMTGRLRRYFPERVDMAEVSEGVHIGELFVKEKAGK